MTNVFLGRNAGDSILEDLRQAQSSGEIITPYISSEYVHLLRSLKNRGIRVSLILSSDLGSKKDRSETLQGLIDQIEHIDEAKSQKKKLFLDWTVALAIGSLILSLVGNYHYQNKRYLWGLAALPVLALVFFLFKKITDCWYTYESPFKLKVVMSPYSSGFSSKNYLVHSKVYIIDSSIAYLGSLNFTKAGFVHNYESRVAITERDRVKQLHDDFVSLFYESNTSCMNIEKVGQEVYKINK